MQLIRGHNAIRDEHKGCVATIGNFDGVHLGHQDILAQVRTRAREEGAADCVIVFEPLPREYFSRERAKAGEASSPPARIQTFRDKLESFEQAGVDQVLCLQFNDALRSLTADEFIRQILVDGLAIRHLVVGDDFRFGCDRKGDFACLQRAGQQYGFTVDHTRTVIVEDERVSSTRIRNLLTDGNFTEAAKLLGHPFTISGRVNHGQKLGRQLGVPTANLRIGRRHCPVNGVYAVRIHGLDRVYNGVANVGKRPTVNGTQERLEVHLLDFDGDLYGCRIRVEFVEKIRGEQKFDKLDDLKLAISNDIIQARKILGQ
ncbi:bifunctional riboflavin kinase/FAD synthetase [Parendozoicomonas haliclonae]|uniref:Riboflavin biosynthesis protein n=1 Tax=Parendozoicomonas haliclonae TaxID=1960125 RepID=A0A1X7AQD9_9GAMM|nr:bifunctional riboflavin kinase/FAD synthetase [Parendozoicomonas haliclonae]SMA50363.1 Riboflavin biosynthesis protein RibF [Parendozoicomonas haliclonae]